MKAYVYENWAMIASIFVAILLGYLLSSLVWNYRIRTWQTVELEDWERVS